MRDARNVEQIVDQRSHVPHLPFHYVFRPAESRGVRFTLIEHFDGVAELMPECGQERIFPATLRNDSAR